jgi:hypothetical protein
MTQAPELGPLHLEVEEADHWWAHAACRGQGELFFPVGEQGSCYAAARAICEQCPVVEPCLEAGLFEHFGMWGAATVRERQALRRRRGLVRPRGPRTTSARPSRRAL